MRATVIMSCPDCGYTGSSLVAYFKYATQARKIMYALYNEVHKYVTYMYSSQGIQPLSGYFY